MYPLKPEYIQVTDYNKLDIPGDKGLVSR